MNGCVGCNEPDDPLDEKTGLCYTCWLIAGMPVVKKLDKKKFVKNKKEEEE